MNNPSHHSRESWEVTRIKLFLAGNTSGIPRLRGIFPLLIRKKTLRQKYSRRPGRVLTSDIQEFLTKYTVCR
jgi:hypothetical protein